VPYRRTPGARSGAIACYSGCGANQCRSCVHGNAGSRGRVNRTPRRAHLGLSCDQYCRTPARAGTAPAAPERGSALACPRQRAVVTPTHRAVTAAAMPTLQLLPLPATSIASATSGYRRATCAPRLRFAVATPITNWLVRPNCGVCRTIRWRTARRIWGEVLRHKLARSNLKVFH
jgi:hypothetical protein